LLVKNEGMFNFMGRRNLATAALKPSTTGGLDAQVPDSTEDNETIKIQGMTQSEIIADSTTAENQAKTNPVDYDAYVKAEKPATTSGSFVAFSLIVFGSIFMLFF
jgi:hypothetical protein